MRNYSKFALDSHANLPAFTGKSTCNFQAKAIESQLETPAKHRQEKLQTRAKKLAESQVKSVSESNYIRFGKREIRENFNLIPDTAMKNTLSN